MDAERYEKVKLYAVKNSTTIKDVIEEGSKVVVSDSGEKMDGWDRVTQFTEGKDATPQEVIDDLLTTVFDAEGDPEIRVKERLNLDDY